MNINEFILKKQNKEKLAMVTCYDYSSAHIISNSDIDCVLIGDSVAMVVYGYKNTTMATIDMMITHTKIVSRGIQGKKFLISDLPFLYINYSNNKLIENVRRIFQSGAQAIKIEGGNSEIYKKIIFLVQSGIPIMGHIGLMPQFINTLGGYKIQGRTEKQFNILMKQAKDLESSGCFAIVIECVPQKISKLITESLNIPTIGIGAGIYTDGQILVFHDLLGFYHGKKTKFSKQYTNINDIILSSINSYVKQVKNYEFPTLEQSF